MLSTTGRRVLALQDCNCSLSDVHLFFSVLPVHKELTDIVSLKLSTYSMVIHLGYPHGLERLMRKTLMDDAFFPPSSPSKLGKFCLLFILPWS